MNRRLLSLLFALAMMTSILSAPHIMHAAIIPITLMIYSEASLYRLMRMSSCSVWRKSG